MTSMTRDARLAAPLLAALVISCATGGYRPLGPLEGPEAFGQRFGAPREEVEAALAAAGAAARQDPGDQDALWLEPCPGAPAPGPCRLLFGPAGLYAAEQEVPAAGAGALVAAVTRGLGAPGRRGAAGEVLAAWEPPGWTVAVARRPAQPHPLAALRAEYDAATPPTVSGVPLGRRRAAVELTLKQQGATLIQQDRDSTSYLGCPLGDAAAISCTITFRRGRAAAVTEVWPGDPDDRHAMEAWRTRADAMAAGIGRRPEARCPPGGPERVEGDCTASWSSDRLLVVVGAHRSPGGQHRGAISVYIGFSYPPLGGEHED